MDRLRSASIPLAIAVAMTLLFWAPLWSGYGLIGGDLYPYFFPQKAFLSDRLHAGEFPLWNPLTGFGYPILGESQTGAAYPPYVLAYTLLDIVTAYNLMQLLHYVICFAGTWLFGRRIGLRAIPAVLTAIVFTYGWFPPRICLEWAIVTGAWLPVALWCVESLIQTRHWRYAIGLSLTLGLQLLAGHFHLAFITELLVLSYGLWRCGIFSTPENAAVEVSAGSSGLVQQNESRTLRLTLVGSLFVSILGGFLLAAVQLIPAWELKTRSSRATVGGDHEPSYGHLPPLYLSQMFAPWRWYSPLEIEGEETIRSMTEFGAPWHWFGPQQNLDDAILTSRTGGLTTVGTNKVEAHLYCGLVPLALACWWLLRGHRGKAPGMASRARMKPDAVSKKGGEAPRRDSLATASPQESQTGVGSRSDIINIRSECWFWGIAGLLAMIYATGWLLPVARLIPGFNFFRGPGRYGIVTTLAVAILAGRGFQRLCDRRVGFGRVALAGLMLWSTVSDLWLVSRMVTYAVMRSNPPIQKRDQSPIRKLLLSEPQSPRLYAPGQNLGNLLGVSCLPVYLGIAPAEYTDPRFAGEGMPKPQEPGKPVPADATFSSWLNECGVTHLLSFYPLEERSWHVSLAWQGVDPLLNSAWGRFDASGQPEPFFLYRLKDSPGRATAIDDAGASGVMKATVAQQSEANQLRIQTETSAAANLVVRDLNYPGWVAEIDGQVANSTTPGSFRQVSIPAGEHTAIWKYRPTSVRIGLFVSAFTLLMLATLGHLRFWHRAWLDRISVRLFMRQL
jgi:hypothetical protein